MCGYAILLGRFQYREKDERLNYLRLLFWFQDDSDENLSFLCVIRHYPSLRVPIRLCLTYNALLRLKGNGHKLDYYCSHRGVNDNTICIGNWVYPICYWVGHLFIFRFANREGLFVPIDVTSLPRWRWWFYLQEVNSRKRTLFGPTGKVFDIWRGLLTTEKLWLSFTDG